MDSLLLYCRPGFENDLASELMTHAVHAGHAGFVRAESGAGWLLFQAANSSAQTFAASTAALPFENVIFARQKLHCFAELRALPSRDRITPILASLPAQPMRWGALHVEHPDSDAGRPLATLCRSFGNALRNALRRERRLTAQERGDTSWLHVFFAAPDYVLLAQSEPGDRSQWPLGIPRLRIARDAPSRSAAKLEEALVILLTAEERERLLQPGMRAADLGAAPGGWSWVLARRGLHVSAVDNGKLAPSALATGLIAPVRADGFVWRPPRPVDWLVCDMVEQPRRVAARMAEWFARGWCRHAIFNLKLPMKKRWQEVDADLRAFTEAAGSPAPRWRARQLYHDREEITVFASAYGAD